MASLARSAVSTPFIRSTVSRDDATMCAHPTMITKAPAPSAKFALRGYFLKGHASLSTSRTASAVAERTSALKISCGESRIGKYPIQVPAGVEVKINGKDLTVKGKLGELKYTLPESIDIEQNEGVLKLSTLNEHRTTKALHGLARALTNNMVKGVSEGWSKQLDLVGVGYRAAMQGTNLQMSLGFSHPVIKTPPVGITVKVEGNTKIVISGYDKCEVGNFAAILRALRPPEPYKGKGVKYSDETILRKEGKSGK